ncbi:MAG TPA: putative 4-hydroxy-4-methyl-2-oxoglutarate aldolase [Gammaproteobacteria bacterium]|nr:putative 4-hydroxy-4-methyl-2-oxoglutarate aldolase [Gammaproteobacteria bacterium]
MEYVTPDLCDEYPQQVRVISPMFQQFGKRRSVGGEVVTIKCFEDNSRVKEQVAESGAGRILLVDGGGSKRCALLGDLLAAKGADSGWAGIIVYGCVRDVDILADIDLCIQALASHPQKSTRRGEGQVNIPITIGGVTVSPGEFLYADNNGVIVSTEPLAMPLES